jgi:hypothetical protein
MSDLGTVCIRKLAWSPELVRYVSALLQVMLARPYGNNDDVPDSVQPLDRTTVGAGIRVALDAGCIVPFRLTIESLNIFGGMRRSSRPECHGHRNPLYQVVAPVAREWLKRHGVVIAMHSEQQMEMSLPNAERVG